MSLGDWIEIDEAPRARAGSWQDAKGLVLRAEGIALASSRRVTAAPWSAVLGVARVGDALFVLVPRKPPAEPWIEIGARDARRANTTLGELEKSIAQRLTNASYRQGATRPLAPPEELLALLVAREPVPGIVEVKLGPGPSRPDPRAIVVAGLGGTGMLAMYAGPLLEVAIGVPGVGLLLSAFVGGALGATGATLLSKRRPRRGEKARVLALAPDGCVAGLPDGVRAFRWQDLAPFEVDDRPTPIGRRVRDEPHLVFRAASGEELGAVHHQWFARPIDLIYAVAEAYRRRFSR